MKKSRIKRIADVLLLNGSFTNDISLFNGKMGIAIFLYKYSAKEKQKIYEEYADELIDEICENINLYCPNDFEIGLSGIGWGIEYLIKNKFIDTESKDILNEFDKVISQNNYTLKTNHNIFALGLYSFARLGEGKLKNNYLSYKKCLNLLKDDSLYSTTSEFIHIDRINSILWFLLEIYKMDVFKNEIEELFDKVGQSLNSILSNRIDLPSLFQSIKIAKLITCITKNNELIYFFNEFINRFDISESEVYASEKFMVDNFIKITLQNLIYNDKLIIKSDITIADTIFAFIEKDKNWNLIIDNLNEYNLGLKGLSGLGLGLLHTI